MLPSTTATTSRIDTAMKALAWGRIALGAASLASPSGLSRSLGVANTPETAYLTRIYGGRAIALGAAYLLADPATQKMLHRLSLGVDVSDTLTGASLLKRRDAEPRAMVALTALTGSYALVGAAKALATLRRG